jgi:hypothetical protein
MVRPAVTLALSTCRLMAPSLGLLEVPLQMTMVRLATLHMMMPARAVVAPRLVSVLLLVGMATARPAVVPNLKT